MNATIKTIETKIELVTPAIAELWLKHNRINREVRLRWVKDLAQMMTDGEFRLTHQGVAFGIDSGLLDGQHRLMAIILSGQSAYMNVTRNLPYETFRDVPIDRHMSRTIADTLDIGKVDSEIAGFLLSLGSTNRFRRNVSIIKKYANCFKPEIELLLKNGGSVKRTRSSSPIKSAVVLNMAINPQEATLIAEQFSKFLLNKLEDLWPVVRVFWNQIQRSASARSTKSHPDLFSRAYMSFNPDNAQREKLRVSDTSAIMEAAWIMTQKLISDREAV